jgi:hypothetical protein
VSGDIDDPFLRMFFSRIPIDVAKSFTRPQLDAIKRAFGARSPGAHVVDLRLSVPLGWRWWYVVLLAGRERRTFDRYALERLFRPVWTAANVMVLIAFFVLFSGAVFSTAYMTKRALNINIVPGIDMLPDRTIERFLH